MKIILNQDDIKAAMDAAEETSNALRVDYSTLSDEQLILLRDKDYGILDTLNMGEDDPEFLHYVDQFAQACIRRRINPGFIVHDPNGVVDDWTPEATFAYLESCDFRKEVFNTTTMQYELVEPFHKGGN